MIVILAGLPAANQEKTLARLRKRLPQFVFGGLSRGDNGGYPSEGCSSYSNRLSEWLVQFLNGRNLNTRNRLVVLLFDNQLGERLRVLLFPSISLSLVRHVSFFGRSELEVAKCSNLMAEAAAESVEVANRYLQTLVDEVHSPSSTALLLPVQNFERGELREYLSRWSYIERSAPPISVEERKNLRSKCGQYSEAKRKFFLDDRSLVFAPPGKYQHGDRRPDFSRSGGHRVRCWLAAHFRLGARINPGFHYDVHANRKPSGAIQSLRFENCHGEEVAPPRNTHVNIYPNDYVR